jgi:hypothetical protein
MKREEVDGKDVCRAAKWSRGGCLGNRARASRRAEGKSPSNCGELASAGKEVPHTLKMPSAYKSVVNRQDSSDEDMSDDGAFLGEQEEQDSGSEASTSTMRAESSDAEEEQAPAKATHMPLELKNRILLLTSRGVSSRYSRPQLTVPSR